MVVLPEDFDKFVARSIVIYCHFLSGIGIGYKIPASFLLSIFIHVQMELINHCIVYANHATTTFHFYRCFGGCNVI